MKTEKVLEKFLACKGVLKIQICSGKKSRKAKLWRVNMRYVPIYLRQGLVVLSLTSGTFLLRDLPLVALSWRSGRRRALLHHLPYLPGFLGGCRYDRWFLSGRRDLWLIDDFRFLILLHPGPLVQVCFLFHEGDEAVLLMWCYLNHFDAL